jgi:hypothetical protein
MRLAQWPTVPAESFDHTCRSKIDTDITIALGHVRRILRKAILDHLTPSVKAASRLAL